MKFKRLVILIISGAMVGLSREMQNVLVKFLPARSHFLFQKYEKVVKIDFEDISFQIKTSPSDDHYENIVRDGLSTWENEALATWLKISQESRFTVVDIGSYLGVYAITAAKAGASSVIAFEPNPFVYSELIGNIKLNNLDRVVKCKQIALGSTDFDFEIIAPKKRNMSSGVQILFPEDAKNIQHGWYVIGKVKCTTLDKVLSDQIATVGAIKIDAEGFEMDILKGAINCLSSSKPKLIIEIFGDEKLNLVNKFLLKFGYEPGFPLEKASPRNYLFEYIQPNLTQVQF